MQSLQALCKINVTFAATVIYIYIYICIYVTYKIPYPENNFLKNHEHLVHKMHPTAHCNTTKYKYSQMSRRVNWLTLKMKAL
jgi:hypothetical protein